MVATKRKVSKTGVTEVNLESINTVIPVMAASLSGNSEPENPENNLECNNSGVTDVTASNDEACNGSAEINASVTGVTYLINNAIDPNENPPEFVEALVIDRPCYAVYDDFNEFGKAGVYYHGIKTDKTGNVTEINYYIKDLKNSLNAR